MPTQKELMDDLRWEMEYLRESVSENSERHSDPIPLDTGNLEELIQNGVDALRGNEKTISDTVDKLIDAFDSGISNIFKGIAIGGLVGGGIFMLLKYLKKINGKTSLIKSIQFLQQEHQHLTYDFIIERSSADRANKEERQTILNELIVEGIVTSYQYEDEKVYEIKPYNPKLLAHWEKAKEVEF